MGKLQFYDTQNISKLKKGFSVIKEDQKSLSKQDIKRLQLFMTNSINYQQILDLVPSITKAYFFGRIPASLSFVQATIILCFGLQHRKISSIQKELDLPEKQVIVLLNKAMKKIIQHQRV